VAIEGMSVAWNSPEFRCPSASSASFVQEGACGCAQTFWKDARNEAVQGIDPYSRLTRSLWSMPGGSLKNAHMSMVLMDMRNSCSWMTVSKDPTPQSWPA
jgi:hypothetical protein